jgi:hypothetical protein
VNTSQYVILSREEPAGNGLAPLGSREEIVGRLSAYHTAPESDGEDILYGPGIRIELPPGDTITQMLMTITEEEIAWQVITPLVKSLKWKLLDPATGREWSP